VTDRGVSATLRPGQGNGQRWHVEWKQTPQLATRDWAQGVGMGPNTFRRRCYQSSVLASEQNGARIQATQRMD